MGNIDEIAKEFLENLLRLAGVEVTTGLNITTNVKKPRVEAIVLLSGKDGKTTMDKVGRWIGLINFMQAGKYEAKKIGFSPLTFVDQQHRLLIRLDINEAALLLDKLKTYVPELVEIMKGWDEHKIGNPKFSRRSPSPS